MKIMKHVAECPNCQHEFETTVAAAQDGLRCPKCETSFVPDSLKQYEDAPKPLPPAVPLPNVPQPKRAEKTAEENRRTLLRKADDAWTYAILFGAISAVCTLIAIVLALFGFLEWGWLFASLAIPSFFLLLWFTLLKHLNHIRAALEKK